MTSPETVVELPAGVEHGTPEGYAAGCKREKDCPALLTHGMCCLYAHIRSSTDVRYYRAKNRNPDPAAIARALGIRPPSPAEVVKDAALDEKRRAEPAHHAQPFQSAPSTPRHPKEEADVPVIEEEAMGHPATPESEEPVVPFETFEKPNPITTDRWTHGMTPSEKALTLRSIREWARTHGFPGVPDRGRIPQDALAAYARAHPAGGQLETAEEPKPAADTAAAKERSKVRAWARDNGFDVPARGAIHGGVLRAYAKAHEPAPDEAPTPVVAERETTPVTAEEFSKALEQVRDRANAPGSEVAVEAIVDASDGPVEIRTVSSESAIGLDVAPDDASTVVSAVPLSDPRPFVDARPEWADVTIPEDIEDARRLAVRLEQELAEAERQRDEAHRALEFVLPRHAAAVEALEAAQGAVVSVRFMYRLAVRRNAQLSVDLDRASVLLRGRQRRLDRYESELEVERSKSIWKRVFGR